MCFGQRTRVLCYSQICENYVQTQFRATEPISSMMLPGRAWLSAGGRESWWQPRKPCQTNLRMSVRPRNHFATPRIAFGRSSGAGSSRYLAFAILGDFELSAAPWPLSKASRPPEEVPGRHLRPQRTALPFSQRRRNLRSRQGPPGEVVRRLKRPWQVVWRFWGIQ